MYLTCPKCGNAAVVCDDVYNTASISRDAIADYCVGHCDNCGVELMWENIYTFKESTTPTIKD